MRPFPATDSGKWQVSTNGGQAPLWAHSGRELFFVDGERNMVVTPVQGGAALQLGARRILFTLGDDLYLTASEHYTPFDLSPDDQRFIMAREVRSATIVRHWRRCHREGFHGSDPARRPVAAPAVCCALAGSGGG